MRRTVASMLKEINDSPSVKERQEKLKSFLCPPLLAVLQGFYDPRIKWILPPGTPPYNKNDYIDQESALYSEYRRFYLFCEGGNPNLTDTRREYLFVQLLEMLMEDDAKLIVAMKDKNMPFKNVTKELVESVIPGVFGV